MAAAVDAVQAADLWPGKRPLRPCRKALPGHGADDADQTSANAGTLALRVVASGGALRLLALASIALTLWVTWQLEGGAAAVHEGGRRRMMSYRMAHEAAPESNVAGAGSGLCQPAWLDVRSVAQASLIRLDAAQ